MFSKVLVANRGEIAIRILRTLHEMGIVGVAVYSEPDRDALHVGIADEAYFLGGAAPAQSYLNADAILDIAARSGADAIHPGYGFFAENAGFARRVIAAGLTWIGPHPDAIDAMGDKLRARAAMAKAKVPFVPGGTEPLADLDAVREAVERFGLPLALKASGGGGGKGLKIVRTLDDIESAFTTAVREAEAYFKNPVVYAERYLDNPKHVELQILADKHGTVLHVGDRDCSLQRRHQKLWEEAPALISNRAREAMRAAGMRAARAIGYDSVGTIECLVVGDDFYFLEMNTRIQVEHTVTEEIAGIDLVREMIRVAAGEPLGFAQEQLHFRGAAIEGRVNAEDPAQNFRPAPGTIDRYREPGGLGIRVDSAAHVGMTISPDYDSMVAKLIVWAPTREQALARMKRATAEYVVGGLPTTLPLLHALCDAPMVADASYGTASLEPFTERWAESVAPASPSPALSPAPSERNEIRVEVNGKLFRVRLVDGIPTGRTPSRRAPAPRTPARRSDSHDGAEILAPMHGVVIELRVAQGDEVAEGEVVAVIEAMKMMNEIRAHRAGRVGALHVEVGGTVEADRPILTLA
uniref:Carbamoyl-phosphate synthase L chain, ATP-binding protein n=1 Tax=mine drainage metagenome TaxID=410659 RepID=E6PIZ8_9ZZZZ